MDLLLASTRPHGGFSVVLDLLSLAAGALASISCSHSKL